MQLGVTFVILFESENKVSISVYFWFFFVVWSCIAATASQKSSPVLDKVLLAYERHGSPGHGH